MATGDQPLWFEQALLPGGWARQVRIATAGGRIAGVETGTPPRSGRLGAWRSRSGLGEPAFPRLPARHGGTGRDARTGRRQLLDLARGHVPLRRAPRPRDLRSGRRDGLCRDAGGRLHPRRRVPLSASRSARRAVCRYRRDGGTAGRGPRPRPASASPCFRCSMPIPVSAVSSPSRASAASSDVESYAALLEASRRATASLGDAVVGAAPHSLRAVTPDELAQVSKLAAPVHIHIAEQTQEVEDCLAWSGRRPVQWLLDNAAVDARWCLVHATHVTEAETAGAGAQRRGSRDCARSPKPIWATASSPRAPSSQRAGASASARIRTC